MRRPMRRRNLRLSSPPIGPLRATRAPTASLTVYRRPRAHGGGAAERPQRPAKSAQNPLTAPRPRLPRQPMPQPKQPQTLRRRRARAAAGAAGLPRRLGARALNRPWLARPSLPRQPTPRPKPPRALRPSRARAAAGGAVRPRHLGTRALSRPWPPRPSLPRQLAPRPNRPWTIRPHRTRADAGAGGQPKRSKRNQPRHLRRERRYLRQLLTSHPGKQRQTRADAGADAGPRAKALPRRRLAKPYRLKSRSLCKRLLSLMPSPAAGAGEAVGDGTSRPRAPTTPPTSLSCTPASRSSHGCSTTTR